MPRTYTVVDDPNLSAILEAYTEAYRPYPLYMPLPPGVRSVRRTGGRMPSARA